MSVLVAVEGDGEIARGEVIDEVGREEVGCCEGFFCEGNPFEGNPGFCRGGIGFGRNAGDV